MKHARDDYNRIQDPAGLIPDDEPVFLLRAQEGAFCIYPKCLTTGLNCAGDCSKVPALTQRPAAQEGDERASFIEWLETTWPKVYPKGTGDELWRNGHLSALAWKAARASLPAPQQATPEWLHLKSYGYAPGDYMSKCLRCGQTPAGLDKRATSCRPCAEAAYADQQATPEPVGEPVGTVEYYQINGEDVVIGYLPRPLPVGTKLYDRPAPGVPETDADALLDFMEAHRVSVTPEYEGQWCARQYDDEPQAVAEFEAATPRDAIRALAAAQAKGDAHD